MCKMFYNSSYDCDDFHIDTTEKARRLIGSLSHSPIPDIEVVSPSIATLEELSRVHARSYVRAFMTGEPSHIADQNGLGEWSPRLRDSVLASVGGVLSAGRESIRTRKNSGSASSGLHHARKNHGAGFCTLNGLAVTATALLAEGAKRILIIDFDAHCGGGTASLIRGVKGIEQIDVSVSSYDQYESGENVWLKLSTGSTYLVDINEALNRVQNPETIDVILYNAGMDPYQGCAVGGSPGINEDVLANREQLVFEWAKFNGVPVAFVLAGGYSGSELTPEFLTDLHRLTLKAAVR